MGVLDTVKMVNKARQARKKMSQMEIVGQSNTTSVLMNGTFEVEEVLIDKDQVSKQISNIDADALDKLLKLIAKDIKNAIKDAKSKLEKEMASNVKSFEDLKDLLG